MPLVLKKAYAAHTVCEGERRPGGFLAVAKRCWLCAVLNNPWQVHTFPELRGLIWLHL